MFPLLFERGEGDGTVEERLGCDAGGRGFTFGVEVDRGGFCRGVLTEPRVDERSGVDERLTVGPVGRPEFPDRTDASVLSCRRVFVRTVLCRDVLFRWVDGRVLLAN